MSSQKLTIGFVRRGYSASGGAEAYLKRLGRGIVDLGHATHLFSTIDWPKNEWAFGGITRLPAGSPIAFADKLEELRSKVRCDVLMSLERIWRCDVYRAGDGVHRAWLDRRRKFELPLERFVRGLNPKHREVLRLEKSLLADRRATRVIVNSQMVKKEIVDLYGYPADKIELVQNGVPLKKFRFDPELREKARDDLEVKPDQIALLFAGSGWERKGLLFAMEAMALCKNRQMRLLVAGRGNRRQYKSKRVQFLGELPDLVPIYAAADIFILPTIYDPFSNACLEALACGLPVITTRANGFSEIIEDRVHGSIDSLSPESSPVRAARPSHATPVGSIVDLANDLLGLRDAILYWSDNQRRATARSIIIERASQFDISKNVGQSLAILVQAAAAHG